MIVFSKNTNYVIIGQDQFGNTVHESINMTTHPWWKRMYMAIVWKLKLKLIVTSCALDDGFKVPLGYFHSHYDPCLDWHVYYKLPLKVLSWLKK